MAGTMDYNFALVFVPCLTVGDKNTKDRSIDIYEIATVGFFEGRFRIRSIKHNVNSGLRVPGKISATRITTKFQPIGSKFDSALKIKLFNQFARIIFILSPTGRFVSKNNESCRIIINEIHPVRIEGAPLLPRGDTVGLGLTT